MKEVLASCDYQIPPTKYMYNMNRQLNNFTHSYFLLINEYRLTIWGYSLDESISSYEPVRIDSDYVIRAQPLNP